MGEQRKNSQLKGNEESPERVINEIRASKLSDTEFKIMIIRKLMSSVRTTKNNGEDTRNFLQTTSA